MISFILTIGCLSGIMFFIWLRWLINYQIPKREEELMKEDKEWADKMRKEGVPEEEIQIELDLLQQDTFLY